MNISVLLLTIFTFVELNCENLFDCRHDSLKEDIEFTPDGARKWTPWKLYNKMSNLAREIVSTGDADGRWTLPDMVALCEVENDSVLFTLTRKSPLRALGYEYVMTDSPDIRGIDVALLWHPGSFAFINKHSFRVKPLEGMRPTRDILYVSGKIRNGDTLHVIVTHAPSRYGGTKRTEPYRMAVVENVNHIVDSINMVSSHPRIIIAGDFNDYADSAPLMSLEKNGMINVSAKATGQNGAKATYKYKGLWKSIDHILINTALKPWLVSCYVHDARFLMEEDLKYGGLKPLRTSNGYRYQNGYSDHLPLVMKVDVASSNGNY